MIRKVNSCNGNDAILKFPEKLDLPFLHVFILVTCFLRVTVLLLCWSQGQTIFCLPLERDKLKRVYLIQLVTGIAMKPQLSGNMLPNIKTCKNG